MASTEHEITRRSVVTVLPSLALALPSISMANSSGAEDPILPLYRKWLAARTEWNRLAEFERDETPEGEAHWNAMFAASDQMQELTPVSPQGIAAQIHVLWFLEGPQCALWSESYKEQCEYSGNQLLLRVFSAATGGGDLIEAEQSVMLKGYRLTPS